MKPQIEINAFKQAYCKRKKNLPYLDLTGSNGAGVFVVCDQFLGEVDQQNIDSYLILTGWEKRFPILIHLSIKFG